MDRHSLRWIDAEPQICHGDLLLWQNGTVKSRLIAVLARGRAHHAAKAARCWHNGRSILLALEAVDRTGGRAVPLKMLVEESPGAIAVYSPNPENRWPEYHADGAVWWMWENVVGRPYGWRRLLRTLLGALPVLRFVVRPSFVDSFSTGEPLYCSGAVSAAERLGGGVDPVPGLSDADTTPADLEKSAFYRYRFHLEP